MADIYDALISIRPYRKRPYDNRTALEELTNMADAGKIPGSLVQALVALNRHDKPDYRRCGLSRERRGTPPKGTFTESWPRTTRLKPLRLPRTTFHRKNILY